MENNKLQLFMQINPSSQLVYEYLAVDHVTFRVIGFGNDYVDLCTYKDREMEMIQSDYVATSRMLDVDMESMDDLIAKCTSQEPYDLVAWMDGSGKCVVPFKGSPDGSIDEVEMYSYGKRKLESLVTTVMISELHRLREEAFMVEEE